MNWRDGFASCEERNCRNSGAISRFCDAAGHKTQPTGQCTELISASPNSMNHAKGFVLQKSKYTTQEQIEAMRSEILREMQKKFGDAAKTERKVFIERAFKACTWIVFLSVFTLLIVTLIGVYAAKSRGETPTIFGAYQLFAVESGSMEPTLAVGSVIVSKKTEHPESLKINQIVTFHMLSGVVVTHRIIEVIKDESGHTFYRTKGDNPKNSWDEELLDPARVIGVFAAKIPFT